MNAPTFSGCGMCGAISLKGSESLNRLEMAEMIRTLRHRGPNASGTFSSKNVSLGHTRLSILDLSEHGKQPMTKENFTISYNGEVYNYPDLRTTLLSLNPSLQLESTTDTEVILRYFQHFISQHSGEGFPDVRKLINDLNGFFAFAIFDESKQRLLLVRDRFGIKPLYYVHQPNEFVGFASEVETLLASKLIQNLRVDLNTLYTFATISTFFTQTSNTLVEGIVSLPPGHFMWVEAATGKVEIGEYWRLPKPDPQLSNISLHEAQIHLKRLVEDSIQLRMVSDVPLSTFLSGGIDSSLITAIASHSKSIQSKEAKPENIHVDEKQELANLHNKVTAFTVTYIGEGQNLAAKGDEDYSRIVAEALGPQNINHQLVPVDPMAFTLEDLDDLSDMGTFSDDDRLLTILLNYRAVAKNGFTVILNGQGADEAMGGYVGAGWFKACFVDAQHPEVGKFDPVLDLIMDPAKLTEELKSHYPKSRKHFHDSWAKYDGEPLVVASQWLFDTSLARILRFEDFLSMRSSVECRVPFLDHRIVDYVFRTPVLLHVNPEDYTGKVVLREVSKSYLPASVCERPKQAFPNVNPEALSQRLKHLIKENLDEIRECPIIKRVWKAEALDSEESVDKLDGSDPWLVLIYWRWWKKFESYGGILPPHQEQAK